MQDLDEEITYEYADKQYHKVTVKGGQYCAFCYGTNHTINSRLERHSLEQEVLPQLSNQRFAIVEHCRDCDYLKYDYVAAKVVVASYYGVVDGQPPYHYGFRFVRGWGSGFGALWPDGRQLQSNISP